VIVLNEQNFEDEVVNASVPVLVDFWAVWCGPCSMIAPVVEEIAKEMKGKVKVGKVNVDEAPALAGRFGIRAIPTLMIFKNGQVVDQIIGVQPKAAIAAALNKLVQD
jgi:thioredoxin 1